ncbi:MAG: right-handed parallel beta-helix repeat-containing protein [Phycisphaerae bacterium]|nr:right-handed parallel beta-helix repeat-containing protein [Phycisphaerae bacterium]
MKMLNMSLVAVVAAVGCTAWGTTFYVPADGTLQAVIDRGDCKSGDEIELAAGTYSGPGYLNVDFGVKNILVRSADPDDPEVVAATVIDCQGAGRAFVIQGGQTAEAGLAGLTIINGNRSSNGAVYVNNWSTPTISRCVIRNCTGMMGGAIAVSNASPTIERCQLVGNSATSGAGIYITGGSPVIKNCIISNNVASHGAGAIYSLNIGHPVVWHCTITDNYGTGNAGAIWCSSTNMGIYGTILWNNNATKGPEILVGGAGSLSTVVDMSYCNVLLSGIYILPQRILSGVGNIEVDPMFTEGDWRLSAESLCIDAGDPDYGAFAADALAQAKEDEKDFYGNPRLSGAAVDIGAAEYFVEDVGEAEGANVRLWPKVINLRGQQKFLFCTITLGGHGSDEIDVDSILLEGTLEPVWTKKFNRVNELVVRFDMDSVAKMVMDHPADTVTLVVQGALLNGEAFEASDTLKIYRQKGNQGNNKNQNVKDNSNKKGK